MAKKKPKQLIPHLTPGCTKSIAADFSNAASADQKEGGYVFREAVAKEAFLAILVAMKQSFASSTHVENMSWLQASAFKEIKKRKL